MTRPPGAPRRDARRRGHEPGVRLAASCCATGAIRARSSPSTSTPTSRTLVHRLDRAGKRLLDDGERHPSLRDLEQDGRARLCAAPSGSRSATTTSRRASLLRDFNPAVADLCDQRPRRRSPTFARPAALIADSSFNAEDLRAAGLGEAAVVPLLLDVPADDRQRRRCARPADGAQRRPNRPEQATRGRDQGLRPLPAPPGARGARLVLVGSSTRLRELPARARAARRGRRSRAGRLHRPDLEPGPRRLVRAGGRVPLDVRARGLLRPARGGDRPRDPVVARGAGAVPETLGSAGLVLDGDELPLVAEALHEVVSSRATRAGLAEAAQQRLAELGPEAVAPRIRAALAPILDGRECASRSSSSATATRCSAARRRSPAASPSSSPATSS